MPMTMTHRLMRSIALAVMAIGFVAQPAAADLVVSQLIVDLGSDRRTADVEILNESDERRYVVIEPS